MMRQALCGARMFDGDRFLDGYAVLIDGGKIIGIMPEAELKNAGTRIELKGGCLVPGFVDVQVNGGGGVLFNDYPTAEAMAHIASIHRKFGTTSLLPTLISDDWQIMVKAANSARVAIAEGIPGIRGIHFEGPYLNVDRKGVHDETKIRPVDRGAMDLLSTGDMGAVVVTLAPENVSDDFIKRLTDSGVRVCAGHTAATFDQIMSAINAGLSGFTHLFNAMTTMGSREPGVVGAALDDPNTWCGIIVDGVHIHPASLRVALRAKKKEKFMLITDAMPTVGLAEKSFVLNGELIQAENGRCATVEGILAGSDLDMATAVRNTIDFCGFDPSEALRMASLYPAEFLGLDDRIGRIQPGYDADLVLLDDQYDVRRSWIAGKEA